MSNLVHSITHIRLQYISKLHFEYSNLKSHLSPSNQTNNEQLQALEAKISKIQLQNSDKSSRSKSRQKSRKYFLVQKLNENKMLCSVLCKFLRTSDVFHFVVSRSETRKKSSTFLNLRFQKYIFGISL